jgi:hypothetical protein
LTLPLRNGCLVFSLQVFGDRGWHRLLLFGPSLAVLVLDTCSERIPQQQIISPTSRRE